MEPTVFTLHILSLFTKQSIIAGHRKRGGGGGGAGIRAAAYDSRGSGVRVGRKDIRRGWRVGHGDLRGRHRVLSQVFAASGGARFQFRRV